MMKKHKLVFVFGKNFQPCLIFEDNARSLFYLKLKYKTRLEKLAKDKNCITLTTGINDITFFLHR
jgi:hypothetical protein